MTEPLLRARDVATLLDVSVETILRWHRFGRLPPGYRIASGVLRWRESEIQAWLEGTRPGVRARTPGGAELAAVQTEEYAP
jgi:predicted DNA-binding transcriptional regulator AlpA